MKEATIGLLAGIAIIALLGGWLFLINLASRDSGGLGTAGVLGKGALQETTGVLGEAAGGFAGAAESSSLQLKACATTLKEAASQGVNLSELFSDGGGLEPPPLPF
jgi:hypothetical protein